MVLKKILFLEFTIHALFEMRNIWKKVGNLGNKIYESFGAFQVTIFPMIIYRLIL